MEYPLWLVNMDMKDLNFIRDFILASGSLKEIAKSYDISYPTVRNRVNSLIEKIKLADNKDDERYVNLIRKLAIEDKISYEAADILIRRYREEKQNG